MEAGGWTLDEIREIDKKTGKYSRGDAPTSGLGRCTHQKSGSDYFGRTHLRDRSGRRTGIHQSDPAITGRKKTDRTVLFPSPGPGITNL